MTQKLVLLGLCAISAGYAQDLSTYTDYATVNNELVVRDFAYIHDLKVDEKLSVERISAGDIKAKKVKANKVKTEELKVTGDALFEDDALFEEDVTIEGDLDVEGDTTIDGTLTAGSMGAVCDLTVGCNILMNNSTSPLIGNILKNNIPFLHNFGTNNTFVGQAAGNFTLTGNNNSGYGAAALPALGAGSTNVAVGSTAGLSVTSGSGNIAVGFGAGSTITTTSNNIDIGNPGVAGDAGVIRIGTLGTHTSAFLQGVYAVALPGPGTQMVTIDPSGQLGSAVIGGGGNVFTSSVELQSPGAGSICLIFTENAGVNERARICSPGDGTNGLYMSANGGVTQHLRLQADGDIALTNNLVFPAGSSTLTTGSIYKGAELFIHNIGASNTAVGLRALDVVAGGVNNSAFGQDALGSLTTGGGNAAFGNLALTSNTTANFNTAFGSGALLANVTGTRNTAVGNNALLNSTGSDNTAVGYVALDQGNVGSSRTAIGSFALRNSTADFNTAVGALAMTNNTTGINNTAVGAAALQLGTVNANNTAIGLNALTQATGDSNVAVGSNAGSLLVSGANNIYISNPGVNLDLSTIRIGNTSGPLQHLLCFIAGIFGATVNIGTGTPVLIDSTGQLGTILSSRRVKENIHDIQNATEIINKLRPVLFNYISDPSKTEQYGLIAEEVAEICPNLVVYDKDGQPMTVKYHLLYAMLIGAIQTISDKYDAMQQDMQSVMARLAALESMN